VFDCAAEAACLESACIVGHCQLRRSGRLKSGRNTVLAPSISTLDGESSQEAIIAIATSCTPCGNLKRSLIGVVASKSTNVLQAPSEEFDIRISTHCARTTSQGFGSAQMK
jgi:hypothetical protein